jgi:hypothetical protein
LTCGKITTHVLDIARGAPAAGVKIRLERSKASTGCSSATAAPITTDVFARSRRHRAGVYRLTFDTAVGTHTARRAIRKPRSPSRCASHRASPRAAAPQPVGILDLSRQLIHDHDCDRRYLRRVEGCRQARSDRSVKTCASGNVTYAR